MGKDKSFMESGKAKLGAVLVGSVAVATNASAALTVAAIDTIDFMTVAGVVVTAAGVFFGVRKALSLLN